MRSREPQLGLLQRGVVIGSGAIGAIVVGGGVLGAIVVGAGGLGSGVEGAGVDGAIVVGAGVLGAIVVGAVVMGAGVWDAAIPVMQTTSVSDEDKNSDAREIMMSFTRNQPALLDRS